MDNDFDSVSWKDEHDDDGLEGTAGESSTGARDVNGKRRVSGDLDTADEEHADVVGFEDGVLECTVGTPLKENDGTKDAYISYLITTHVRCPQPSLLAKTWLTFTELRRPTSSPSSDQTSLSVDALRIFITSTKPSSSSIRHAPSHLSQINTRWNMSVATDSAQISHIAAHGRYIASSNVLLFTLFFVAHQYSLRSSSRRTGMRI